MPEYDDNNSYCLRTYSTLRIFSGEMLPAAVTEQLAIQPSRVWHRDGADTVAPRKRNGWFLTTRGSVESKDTRRHIDWLLEQLNGHEVFLQGIRAAGGDTDMMCFWHSAGLPEGGPTLGPAQMAALSALGMTVSWNIYFDP